MPFTVPVRVTGRKMKNRLGFTTCRFSVLHPLTRKVWVKFPDETFPRDLMLIAIENLSEDVFGGPIEVQGELL